MDYYSNERISYPSYLPPYHPELAHPPPSHNHVQAYQPAPPPFLHYQAHYHGYPFYPQPNPVQDYTHTHLNMQYPEQDHSVHIHSPIPVSAYSTLLPSLPENASQQTPAPSFSQPASVSSADQPSGASLASPSPGASQAHPDQYVHTPQVMFPTPCDLLNDLAVRDRHSAQATSLHKHTQLQDDHTAPDTNPKTKSRSSSRKKQSGQGAVRPENQRKAYFRSVADNVHFQPTDPDSITSHDKKRHYLECLEKYILWLHEQLRLVGKDPVSLERIASYKGLNSRSIRTMLVHMQDEAKKLNEQILEEEQDFLDLQEQIVARNIPVNIQMPEVKRNSVAAPMMGLNINA
ncbi:hypothetical protein EUX98_g4113 [Antrodiella citrinella]|uniref:Uncharacterized protein n=1 Tax=Antrodiella citrinella TaxID=2447956 RepID=A0A4S4MUW5_9APHY|nr:hypothetical protein EUX98_g4113 [Antrodiella citrinella]